MKLIIQIPCFNEAKILPETLNSIPSHIPGIKQIELLVIDDGSTDETAEVAEKNGVHHVLRLNRHVGLAGAFVTGLDKALSLGADIIVNTDADNQYKGEEIPLLLEPLMQGRAEMAIGDRGVSTSQHFSRTKRILQKMGSKIVELVSGLETPDATSGFRAMSRTSAMRILVMSDYTYTLETLILAGAQHWAVEFVPITSNPQTRPSRLMSSTSQYVRHSAITLIRSYAMYRPLRIFTLLGMIIFGAGTVLSGRFLYYFLIGEGTGHVQSLILAAVLHIVGFQTFLIGLIADLVGFNRRILDEVLFRIRRLDHRGPEEWAE